MDGLNSVLGSIADVIWGTSLGTFGLDIPVLSALPLIAILLLGTGFYLTVRLRFMPIWAIPRGFAMLWRGRKTDGQDGEVTPFAALATALSSTVGTGNIAGVATAIAIGGPGAIFWMWMTALVGMATKYSESLLAVRYREVDSDGTYKGGPMYYIKNGLGPKWGWLAVLFCVGALASSAGAGNMVQGNSIVESVATAFSLGEESLEPFSAFRIIAGLLLAGAVFVIIIGGIKSIGSVASRLVPFMAVSYVLLAVLILVLNFEGVPGAFGAIFDGAFSGSSAVGGFTGAVIAEAIRMGVARGLFSNEAGQGSAPIAHAAAQTKDPVQQATIAMLGTFIDTLVICTMTALIILSVRVDIPLADGALAEFAWQTGGLLEASGITTAAFEGGLAFGNYFIAIALFIFAFTTILGWSYYGERAIAYLAGERAVRPFRYAWCVVVFLGAVLPVQAVWTMGDIGNGLMATPNLIAVILLSGVVVSLSRGGGERKVRPYDASAHAAGLYSNPDDDDTPSDYSPVAP